MEKRHNDGLFKRIGRKFARFFEDLKEDSVGNNPQKPVDCCNPPVFNKKPGKGDR